MHHANKLQDFVGECVRVLKPNGLLLTVRDHVVFDEKDKAWFLEAHPLHHFYGGENAYSAEAYRQSIKRAGATVVKELKHYDSVINYFPSTPEDIERKRKEKESKHRKKLKRKIGVLVNIPLVWQLYKYLRGYSALNESQIAGRMYSYIALKK